MCRLVLRFTVIFPDRMCRSLVIACTSLPYVVAFEPVVLLLAWAIQRSSRFLSRFVPPSASGIRCSSIKLRGFRVSAAPHFATTHRPPWRFISNRSQRIGRRCRLRTAFDPCFPKKDGTDCGLRNTIFLGKRTLAQPSRATYLSGHRCR